MRRVLVVGHALVNRSFGEYAAYRGEMVIWVLAGTLPLFMMFIWMELAADGPLGGYDQRTFALYFIIAFVMRHATTFNPIQELDKIIRRGELTSRLLRPLNPYWYHAVEQVVETFSRWPTVVPVCLLMLTLTDAWGAIPVDRLPWFAVAAVLGAMIHFHALVLLGFLAFWTERVRGLEGLYAGFYMGLGGAVAPLALFPQWVQDLVGVTPFRYIIAFPVETLTEPQSNGALATGIALQVAWLLGLMAAGRIVWLLGLRRYEAVGA